MVQATYKGGNSTFFGGDAFVVQLSGDGRKLEWSTYLGGASDDAGLALALSASGDVFVGGVTLSNDFPTTPGAFQISGSSVLNKYDGFLAKVSKDGKSLVWSSYFHGIDDDIVFGLTSDGSGAPIVVGRTMSSNFPTTFGSYRKNKISPGFDVFVSKFKPGGTALAWSSYLGGTSWDIAFDVAWDASLGVVICGSTDSKDFPVTSNSFDQHFQSNSYSSVNAYGEAFLTLLKHDGSSLAWSSFLGGSDQDAIKAVKIGYNASIIVSGVTTSSDFVVTPHAHDRKFNGSPWTEDSFLACIDPMGHKVLYSTFLGGSWNDNCISLCLPSDSEAVVGGITNSSNFPVSPGAYQKHYAGGVSDGDGFIAKLKYRDVSIERLGVSPFCCNGPIVNYAGMVPQSGDQNFFLSCWNSPPSSLGLLLIGAGRFTLPFSYSRAKVYVDIFRQSFFGILVRSDASGMCSVNLPIPAGTSGLSVYSQFLWLGTTGCGGVGQVYSSDCLKLSVK